MDESAFRRQSARSRLEGCTDGTYPLVCGDGKLIRRRFKKGDKIPPDFSNAPNQVLNEKEWKAANGLK